MTREQAINYLRSSGFSEEQIQEIVKALEQEPRKGRWISHREHCEMNNLLPSGLGSYFWCSECDCGIDSKCFHRVNYNYCPNCGAKMESVECQQLYCDVNNMPSVTPIRPKGHWIDHSDEGYVECPKCGSATNCDDNISDLHFCFSCGAEMESEVEE